MNKFAPVAGLALVVVVILIIALTGQDKGPEPKAPVAGDKFVPQSSPVPASSAANSAAGAGNAPMLESLVAGLEAKVKADPGNTDNQLLLAQTYAELGRQEDALNLIKQVRGAAEGNARVRLVSAMVLMKSGDPASLNEALSLLQGLEELPGAQVGQVILQRGKIQSKLGNAEQATKTWRDGLARLPEGDPVRKELEKALSGG